MIVYMKSSYYILGFVYLVFSVIVFILGMAAAEINSKFILGRSALFGPATFIATYGYYWRDSVASPDTSIVIILFRRLLDGYLISYLFTSGIMAVSLHFVLRAKRSIDRIGNMLLFIFLWLLIGYLSLDLLVISSISV